MKPSSYQHFVENLPHRRDESWKYTNLNFFFKDDFQNASQGRITFEQKNGIAYLSLINQVDESFENEFVKITLSEFTAPSLSGGNLQHDKAYSMLLGSDTKCLELEVKNNLHTPLLIDHRVAGEGQLITSILKISTTKEKLDLLEVFSSEDENKNLLSNLTILDLATNQRINHTKLQRLNSASMLLGHTISKLERDSHYQSVTANIGSRLTRESLHSEIRATNATSEIHGINRLSNMTHVDTNSFISHAAPHSYSKQLYKAVVDDSARSVFTGMIRVEKDSQKIESEQLNKNMLIGQNSHANSRPQLEIYADDVKCSHGSTTGQMSEEQLFYFTARGISETRARQMLGEAFVNEVLLLIDNLAVRSFVKDNLSC